MKRILLLAGLISIAFAACNGDDPATPDNNPGTQNALKACFNVDKDFIDSGQFVVFTNCSENEKRYEWKFNNGAPIVDKTPPARQYNERGTFPVVLIVWNDDNSKADTARKNITVARHALTKINIKKFKATDGSGNPWDEDGTGPDIKIQFGPNSNPLQYTTAVKENANGEFSLDITPNIILDKGNNGGWGFKLIDEDAGGVKPMTTFGGQANPIYPSRALSSPFNIFKTSDYEVELEYVLVK
ncbi:MAG: PKD domain-containing protein [Bacteroidia bacterium]